MPQLLTIKTFYKNYLTVNRKFKSFKYGFNGLEIIEVHVSSFHKIKTFSNKIKHVIFMYMIATCF